MKIPNLIEIAQAWKISYKPTEEQQLLAEERVKVCNDCEFNVFSNTFKTYKCDACGCFIHKKIYSPNPKSCPKNKWKR